MRRRFLKTASVALLIVALTSPASHAGRPSPPGPKPLPPGSNVAVLEPAALVDLPYFTALVDDSYVFVFRADGEAITNGTIRFNVPYGMWFDDVTISLSSDCTWDSLTKTVTSSGTTISFNRVDCAQYEQIIATWSPDLLLAGRGPVPWTRVGTTSEFVVTYTLTGSKFTKDTKRTAKYLAPSGADTSKLPSFSVYSPCYESTASSPGDDARLTGRLDSLNNLTFYDLNSRNMSNEPCTGTELMNKATVVEASSSSIADTKCDALILGATGLLAGTGAEYASPLSPSDDPYFANLYVCIPPV